MSNKDLTNSTSDVLLLIPGVSGGVNTLPLYDAIAAGFKGAIMRCTLWDSIDDLEEMTFHEIVTQLDELIALLAKSYKRVFVLGKSFGGTVALHLQEELISGIVLLAPACTFGDEYSYKFISQKKLSTIDFKDIKISATELPQVPFLVLHALDDSVVPISNSKNLISASENASGLFYESGGHSYENSETQLAEDVMRFFDSLN